MNLSFFSRAFWWDLLFVLILTVCIHSAARRGAFRALAGLAGTLAGFVLGNVFQGKLAPLLEPALRPAVDSLVQKADLSQLANVEEGSLFSGLATQGALADKMSALYQSLMEQVGELITTALAPVAAFFLIFIATKLAIRLLCLLLDLDIPLLSGLNRAAGAILGAAAGCVTIVIVCWAVMRFAPVEPLGLLSQECLRQSLIGGLLAPLFTPKI